VLHGSLPAADWTECWTWICGLHFFNLSRASGIYRPGRPGSKNVTLLMLFQGTLWIGLGWLWPLF